MKIKTILSIVVLLLLVGLASATATYDTHSIRATGGTINYIGGDDEFMLTRNYFSASARVKTTDGEIDYFGSAAVNIRAITAEGDLITLILQLKPTEVRSYTDGRIYIDNIGIGTYYRTNAGMECSAPNNCKPVSLSQRIKLDSVRFDITDGGINIAGGEGTRFAFRITEMR